VFHVKEIDDETRRLTMLAAALLALGAAAAAGGEPGVCAQRVVRRGRDRGDRRDGADRSRYDSDTFAIVPRFDRSATAGTATP